MVTHGPFWAYRGFLKFLFAIPRGILRCLICGHPCTKIHPASNATTQLASAVHLSSGTFSSVVSRSCVRKRIGNYLLGLICYCTRGVLRLCEFHFMCDIHVSAYNSRGRSGCKLLKPWSTTTRRDDNPDAIFQLAHLYIMMMGIRACSQCSTVQYSAVYWDTFNQHTTELPPIIPIIIGFGEN